MEELGSLIAELTASRCAVAGRELVGDTRGGVLRADSWSENCGRKTDVGDDKPAGGTGRSGTVGVEVDDAPSLRCRVVA